MALLYGRLGCLIALFGGFRTFPFRAVVNNYFILFYIGYMRGIPDPFSGVAHPCEGGSCLSELQKQLLVVFSTKTLGKQVANTLKPFVLILLATVQQNALAKKMIDNAQKGIAAVPAISKAADFIPRPGNLLRGSSAVDMANKSFETSEFEHQSRMPVYEGTFDDFNDRAIQFGYIVLFAPAYPLAPLLALINNIVEIRSAAYRQCKAFQRPMWKARAGIGSWNVVMTVLGYMAVITNASMISFVGSQQVCR
jgi:hypothetical protein